MNRNNGIEELGLSVRAFNALAKSGIRTVGDLSLKTEKRIKKIRGLGEKSFREIVEKMEELGLKFAESECETDTLTDERANDKDNDDGYVPYKMDYIPEAQVFKAVMFARSMIRNGERPQIAIYRASRYYKVNQSKVAHYVGQVGGRS